MMRVLVVMLTVGCAAILHADAQAPPSSTITPLLDALVGKWRMAGQVGGRAVSYDLTVQTVLADRYIELHMKDVARPPQYEALVFIGPDSAPDRIIVHWLDVFGAVFSVPHGVGTISGNTLQFEIAYRDGPFRDTFTYRPVDRSWQFRLESGDGRGGWQLFAEYAVRRAER